MSLAAWRRLEAQAQSARDTSILSNFHADPDRLSRMSVEAAGLFVDLSKQSWTKDGLEAALDLARAAGVEAARAKLFAGGEVNTSEHRAVLHPALRAPDGAHFSALGVPVSAEVVNCLKGLLAALARWCATLE